MNIIQRAESEWAAFEAWKADFLAKAAAGIKEVEDMLSSVAAIKAAATAQAEPVPEPAAAEPLQLGAGEQPAADPSQPAG